MNVDNIKVIPPVLSDSILSGTDEFACICCGEILSAGQMMHRKYTHKKYQFRPSFRG
jgi:hypothetical protein